MADQYHGYSRPSHLMPQWRVGMLVFQGGVPNLRMGSLTGGGQLVARPLVGTFQPYIITYGTRVQSLVGGGQVAARPGFLSALFGGTSGNGS